MTAVAVEILLAPPAVSRQAAPIARMRGTIDPDAIQLIGNTDDVMTMCSCSASSDQSYHG
jgi:hypothetical protein